MKSSIFLLVLLSTILFAYTTENNKVLLTNSEIKLIEELRLTYYKAVEDEDSIEDYENFVFKNFSAISDISKALAVAYKAGIDAVKSKHAFWPLSKLNYLKKSMESLERAIIIESDNLEIRFMRFSILHYVPGFLGYSAERDEDAKVIFTELLKKNYGILDKKIQKGIFQFLIESDRLSEKDSQLLISQLKEHFSNE